MPMTRHYLAGWIVILGIVAAAQAGASGVVELGDNAPQARIDKMWADYAAAIQVTDSHCDSAPAQLAYRAGIVTNTSTHRVTRWTGSCRDGKRDGVGFFATRDERSSASSDPQFNSTSWSSGEAHGAFVAGKPLGLWCDVEFESSHQDSKFRLTPGLCGISGSMARYRKESDGRWRQMTALNSEVHKPEVFLPAGELERESGRILTLARSGSPVTPGVLSAVLPAFGDLVGGGKLRISAFQLPIELRSKRIAIVLTAKASSELERFKVMRQALMQASAQERKVQSQRDAFITESDPARVFAGLAAAIKAHGGSVVASEDLSALQTGAADYAIVVDWRFLGEFALSPNDYKSVTGCPDPGHPTCRHFFRDAFGFALLDRELVVQGLYEWSPEGWIEYYHETMLPYSTFLEILSNGFKNLWNVDTGRARFGADGWLKSMRGQQ